MTAHDETTVTVRRDVPFHAVDGEQLFLDVYDAPNVSSPKPAAVLVRGGGFTVGDKGEFARQAIDLAESGYLVVEPQYRLAPEWTFPAALIDVKAAIEWCRTESEGVDPQRVAGVGHSAGATLVVLAAATADDPALEPEQYPGASSTLSTVVGYAGIYDFALSENSYEAYLGEHEAAVDLASPVRQADMSMPPTLLVHGRDDAVVSPQQTELMAETLAPLTTVEHERVPGGHGFPFDGAHYDETDDLTTGFLQRHLGATARPEDGPIEGRGPREPPADDGLGDDEFPPR